jgi:hypothetical protein
MKWPSVFQARFSPVLAGLCLGFVFVTQVCGADWSVETAPEYDGLFQRTNGWTGADGDFTVALTNGLTLWLFSDTFIGEVRNGHRINTTMVHNSAAWQHGTDPATVRIDFFQGKSSDGKPQALITPADGKGWFWLFDGVMVQGKLYLFLTQIEHTSDQSVFGFRQIGTWLGEVSNPLAPPTQWQIVQKKIPFARFGTDESRSFGSALLVTNGFIYVFGTHDRKGANKAMILLRAPEKNFGDFATWQFRTDRGWSTNAADAADLCDGMASEYSVSWLSACRRYVLICTKNCLSGKIMARTAREPWGPWSKATVIYHCPETAWGTNIFCYAAKAHPMLLLATNELIVTYAANSLDFSQIVNDARLYWPIFVRLKFNSD